MLIEEEDDPGERDPYAGVTRGSPLLSSFALLAHL
jgi:hypothetical protein